MDSTQKPPARLLRTAWLPVTTALMIAAALALTFFYAPLEAQEGFLQKIFYLHVPLAIVTLCGFVYGGLLAIAHLRTREVRYDVRSYVAIHMSLIFGVCVLITGSIWAKGSWGHWWVWNEPTLDSFLIIMLLYCTYQPLRFAIEDRERQARYASVFAITAGAFVPMAMIVVRLAPQYVHPRVLSSANNLPAPMGATFVVALLAFSLLYATLWRLEVRVKLARFRLRALQRLALERAQAPLRAPLASPGAPLLVPSTASADRSSGRRRQLAERGEVIVP
ncbi:MAG TPA: cytochrome c biogenesis protein [Solirubrobacteraceae bacterium]|nr:cytochrome c biogenesis protein [Solirubrobacteraceae bacterium]